MVLARRISRKKVVTKATPVGGGTEAERASETKDIRSLRSAVRQAEIRRLPEEISTINDKYLPREKNFFTDVKDLAHKEKLSASF